jgi:pseudouridine synthase
VRARLQKILSTAGLASRRAAEGLIRAGRVTVNGIVVRELGTQADPAADVIALDGERVRLPAATRTIALHKPRGVVSTLDDPQGRPTVRDLIVEVPERLYPVGRLDLQSAGLLLLTNDGALHAGLTHPRRAVERVYHAKVTGRPALTVLARLTRGVHLDDGLARASRVRLLERSPTKCWLEITVREGRSHLVRRLCDAIGHPVDKLVRVRLGPIALGTLPLGAWRDLTAREMASLHAAAGLSRPRGEGGAASGAPPRRAGDMRPRTRPRKRAAPGRDGARDAEAGPPAARTPRPRRAPRRQRP